MKSAKVTGSNPVEALIFFRFLPSNCLNWKFTTMITLHFHLQPQYNMHFIYIFHLIWLAGELFMVELNLNHREQNGTHLNHL